MILYNKFWDLADRGDAEMLLDWINNLLNKKKDDLDLRYLFLEILRWNNLDVEDDAEEPKVLMLCTETIKNKETLPAITIAKAYCYRGEMRHYGIDRRKDFDKAKAILKDLNQKDTEVKFLNQFIEFLYPLDFRQYLFIDTDYRNLFKF